MSVSELSEMIVLNCAADLPTSNDNADPFVHIVDKERRLSVKQMTATELAAARKAANIHVSFNDHDIKIKSNSPSSRLTLTEDVKPKTNELLNDSNIPQLVEAYFDSNIKRLPASPVPRDRITSLPTILDEGMEKHFLNLSKMKMVENSPSSSEDSGHDSAIYSPIIKPQLDQFMAHDNSLKNENQHYNLDNVQTKHDSEEDSNAMKNSLDDSLTTKRNSIFDSIEMLRQQRRDHQSSRENDRDPPSRSFSPDVRRFERERCPAPDRLDSSSISSNIASPMNDDSKTSSRRSSNNSEALSDIPTVMETVTTVLPTFPLSKTCSAPNIERRKSSLMDMFPGPSPLIIPEQILHTTPFNEIHQDEFTNECRLSKEDIEQLMIDSLHREIPSGKQVHRTKTPPPVGVKLGVNLKKVTPPRTHISVKKNDAPMLGVVLRKVEKKTIPQKSILDDEQPLYHLSIVRNEKKETKEVPRPVAKPKPKPVTLQKSNTVVTKPNSGGILTGPQNSTVRPVQIPPQPLKPQRPQPGVPITIQKIEGDKIIIIKKFIIPKNGKIPEQYLKVGDLMFCLYVIRFA